MKLRRMTLVSVVGLIAGLLAVPTGAVAQTPEAPQIRLLDPSSHSDVLSDKPAQDSTYRLAAWTKGTAPDTATDKWAVEFELLTTAGTSVWTGVSDERTGDTFYLDWAIPNSINDGATYKLRATLFKSTDGGTTYDDVSMHERNPVQVRQGVPIPGSAAETVDIVYPTQDGTAGWFDPDGAGAAQPFFLVDTVTSADATFTTLFYTVSDPGEDPEWTQCGQGGGGTRSIRCTLVAPDQPSAVTGLAAVANDTPGGEEYSDAFDDSGDALRVFPYQQTPSNVTLTPQSQDVAETSNGTYPCAAIDILVRDQLNRKMSGVNYDVHATGPTDQLRFFTGGTSDVETAPNSGGHTTEPGTQCSTSPVTSDDGPNQGEHQQFLADDVKHVEGTTGSNGTSQFRLRTGADQPGTTFVTAWADTTPENDEHDAGEAEGAARIRWGQQIKLEPESSTAERTSCQRFEVTTTSGAPAAKDVGVNVDIHLSGPTAAVDFCAVDGGSEIRDPDANHVGDQHDDGTRHGEAETNSDGKVVFGVRSNSVGKTTITAWRDDVDDDMPDGDQADTSEANWTFKDDRTISIRAGRYRVPSGRRTAVSGRIVGDPPCRQFQTVKLMARNRGASKFFLLRTLSTNSDGEYRTLVRITRTRDYKAITPATDSCVRAVSRVIRIRAT